MSSNQNPNLTALIVDDDPDALAILSGLLGVMGIASQTCSTAEAFRATFAAERPRLCLVDLNIGNLGVGFKLIEEIRAQEVSSDEPALVIVVSGESDSQSIAHAIELGANDYIIKPVDRGLLSSKLTAFLEDLRLREARPPEYAVPASAGAATLEVDFAVEEIDDLGIKLRSSHLLCKGAVIAVSGHFITELTGNPHPHLMKVISTSIAPDHTTYWAYVEFLSDDPELLSAIRRWVIDHSLPAKS